MRFALVVGILFVAAWASNAAVAGESVWVEGESPVAADFKWKAAEGGKEGILSGGKWLASEEPKWAEKGFTATYEMQVPKDGEYNLWLRVGFEWCRPLVSFSFDDGPWTSVGIGEPLAGKDKAPKVDYTRLSTNVKELGLWCEAAWWNVGAATLKTGKRKLSLRFQQAEDERVLINVDVVALVQGKWEPEGRLKPGEEYGGEDDLKAAAQVYELPKPEKQAGRSAVELTGLWQVARYDDPDMDKGTYEPVAKIPSPEEYRLHWLGIQVPLSLWQHKETTFAHRAIYRTKVNIPAELKGRGFKLHFQGTNWIASVFVNGQLAGTHEGVWVPWDLDISKLIVPGKANEIAVAVKGPYYAFDTAAATRMGYDRGGLNRQRNRPAGAMTGMYWVAPIYPSDKGDGYGLNFGIVNPVSLVVAGDAYVDDVFVKTSVAKKELVAEVTLRNTSDKERTLSVLCEAVCDKDGKVEKAFGPAEAVVPANGVKTVTIQGKWDNPKLWWPKADPDLYRLRATVTEKGAPVDANETLFGFREITIDGTGFRLNGLRRNFWNWVDVAIKRPKNAKEIVDTFNTERNRFLRFSSGMMAGSLWGSGPRQDTPCRSREEYLENYDRLGIPGRLCSMIDGMFITFILAEQEKDPDDPKKTRWVLNKRVWDGYRLHLEQMVKAYRNHPSVLMYQAENELVFINGQNRYGPAMDLIQQGMADVIEAARKFDPTRSFQVGGAGDLGGRIETNCPHYPEGDIDWYPENAYTLEKFADHVKRWPWKKDKPWIPGESAFAMALEFGTSVLGDEVYRGGQDAMRGKAAYLRMLYGGYRWAGVAAFHPWDNLAQFEDARKVMHPLYVIPRKQTSRLYAGQENRLLFKAMNDTLQTKPLTLEWAYEASGKKIAGGKEELAVEPGFGKEVTLVIPAPSVEARLEGTLTISSSMEGEEKYVDVRSVAVLPKPSKLALTSPVILLDRSGKVAERLTALGITFNKIEKPTDLKGRKGLLIVGPDSLTEPESCQTDIVAFAVGGGRAVVLEQKFPLGGSGLPTLINSSTRCGGYAFPQALGTPVFRDLGREDLIDWAGDHPTYQAVYWKPTSGGRSLAQAGDALQFSPLVEVGCGSGVMILCQLRVGAKLGLDPAADILFRNLLTTNDMYDPATGLAALFAPDQPLLADTAVRSGLKTEPAASVEACLDPAKYRVAVIQADAKNLAALDRLKGKADAFQEAGGWIMLCGLGRDGLDTFNKFVGVNHMLRPFRVERETLLGAASPVAARLGNRDVQLYSGKEIQHGKIWVDENTCGLVVDNIDVAPFAKMPDGPDDPFVYQPKFHDSDPYNYVNGLLASDHWKYIRQIGVREGENGAAGSNPRLFTLRRPETIGQINIWNNIHYHTIETMEIVFDGDAAQALRVTLPDSGEKVEIKLPAPRKVEKTISLRVVTWRDKANSPDFPQLVGIDSVQFLRAEPPPKAVFLDSAGGLVAYPKGKGGVFLCQIQFLKNEPNPVNSGKKAYLLGMLLQNMGVGSRSAAIAVAGHNVKYEPINLTKFCNHYMMKDPEQGQLPSWIGLHSIVNLKGLAKGEQHLANVLFYISDYSTAPVPDFILIRGSGSGGGAKQTIPTEVKGIPIGKKADVLFFLQGGEVSALHRWNEAPLLHTNPNALPEVAHYVLHYADGQTAEIPVLTERHVSNFLQKEDTPKLISGADVAWSGPQKFGDNKIGVLYSMKAVNPRPDVEIATLDIVEGKTAQGKPTNRGVFGVIAITLGRVVKGE